MRNVALAACAVLLLGVWPSAALTLCPGNFEIVTGEKPCAVVRFAAQELRDFCAGTLGAEVPVVARATPGRFGVHLGLAEWQAAGLATNRFTRDACAIRVHGGAVYVAGRDDPAADTFRAIRAGGVWAQHYERATIFGLYEFAERFLGVRLYFPGELGTVMPKKTHIAVPDDTDIFLAPVFLDRNVSVHSSGAWFEPVSAPPHPHNYSHREWPGKNLQSYRLRQETFNRPCCHGSNGFRYLERFKDSHPEYFTLLGNGKRGFDPSAGHVGQLCWSSGVMEEMYQDVKTYLTGGPAESRGLKRWWFNTRGGNMVDVMPQDGYQRCHCEACTRAYTDEAHYATDLVWGQVARLAKRLQSENVPGEVMMMAYTPYRRVPAVDLPPNVQVMVAETGPWSMVKPEARQREYDEVKAWTEKLGHKVWLWNYANKYGALKIADVPSLSPRAVSRYYKSVLPLITGAFMESECDRYLYNYLNFYAFSRVAWHPEEDIEDILAEHHRLMFGPGAGAMTEFFDTLERLWTARVAGETIDTPLGPQGCVPGDLALWTEIYSPAVMARLDALLSQAAQACAAHPLEAKRVALFRREFYAPLAARAGKYVKALDVAGAMADRAAHPARRNLLVNGDFAVPCSVSKRHYGAFEKGRWQGGWITGAAEVTNVARTAEAPAGLPASLCLAAAQSMRINVTQALRHNGAQCQPGRRYRVSFFLKLDNVVPTQPDGGFGARVWHDRNIWFPHHRLTGTTDWIHQEYFFVAGPGAAACDNTLTFLLWNATGRAYVAGARLEEVPFDDALRATLDRYVDAGRIAGVVSVLSDAEGNERYDCVGWADREARRPMSDDTVFAIFSMTKTFLGAAMMCAIDEGKISLDDPVSKYLPEFADVKMSDGRPPKRPLTVRDLTCHVNGFRGGYELVNRDIPMREVARRLAAQPLATQPGEAFSYGTATFDAAGACLEVATGQSFEAYLKAKILDPLGMVDTTFSPNDDQVRRLVKAYSSDEPPLRPAADNCARQLVFPKAKPLCAAPGGGLFSTPRDVLRFSQMLARHGTWRGKTIISRKTFDTIFAVKQTPRHLSQPYTCGSWLYGDWFGHEGAMRTDQRANLFTGHSRLFFIQTENRAGSAFFALKADWHAACDAVQDTPKTVFGN